MLLTVAMLRHEESILLDLQVLKVIIITKRTAPSEQLLRLESPSFLRTFFVADLQQGSHSTSGIPIVGKRL